MSDVWEDIEKLEGYHTGTSGSEFNLPDFSARLTCAANMDMDGEVMGAKGGLPPPELAQKGPKYPWKSSQRSGFFSDTEYWTRLCEQVYQAQ